jgi:hypothetical protein
MKSKDKKGDPRESFPINICKNLERCCHSLRLKTDFFESLVTESERQLLDIKVLEAMLPNHLVNSRVKRANRATNDPLFFRGRQGTAQRPFF